MENSGLLRDIYAAFVIYHGTLLIGIDMCFTSSFIAGRDGFTVHQEGFLASISVICRAVGSLVAMLLIDRLGRKGLYRCALIVGLVAWLVIACSYSTTTLYLGRALSGITIALQAPCNIYVSEICHKDRRGRLIAWRLSFVSIGVLLVCVTAYFYHWRVIACIAVIICLFGLLQLHFIPESKIWYLARGNFNEAVQSAQWFSGNKAVEEIKEELWNIERTLPAKKAEAPGIGAIFTDASALRTLVVLSTLEILQSGCGRTSVLNHVEHFFDVFQNTFDSRKLIIGLGAAELLASCVYILLNDLLKRKTVLYYTVLLMAISLGSILIDNVFFSKSCESAYSVYPVLMFYFYMIINTTGLIASIQIIKAEIIRYENRGVLSNLASFFHAIASSVYTNALPYLLKNSQIRLIIIFFLVNTILIAVVVRVFVPETSHRELHECGRNLKNSK